ncbi:hypothetical protein CR513_59916, partial [Mucuna pruriens]
MFIDTLESPFYNRVIGNVSLNFSNLVIVREKVEMGVRSGRIAQGQQQMRTTPPPPQTNAIVSTLNLPNQIHIPYYQPHFAYHPQSLQPPYLKNYDSNAKCDYYVSTIGLLRFEEKGLSIGSNLLPNHGDTSINAIENNMP